MWVRAKSDSANLIKKNMNLGTAIALDFAAHVQCEPK